SPGPVRRDGGMRAIRNPVDAAVSTGRFFAQRDVRAAVRVEHSFLAGDRLFRAGCGTEAVAPHMEPGCRRAVLSVVSVVRPRVVALGKAMVLRRAGGYCAGESGPLRIRVPALR